MSDLDRAFEAIAGKQKTYTGLFQYADGTQPLIYSTARLRAAFSNITARFNQNWCAVVINAVLDRLQIKGWDVDDKAANQALDAIWSEAGMALEAYDAHNSALITGEAFIIAYPSETGMPDVYYNDPRMVHVFYDQEHPKNKEYAAKMWKDGALYRMTLYYPDRLEYYEMRSKSYPSTSRAFQPSDPPQAPNEFGMIPVFHFRMTRRGIKGELDTILTLQDAVNKLFADMMVTAEFGAFPQRYIISAGGDIGGLKNAPNEVWDVPGAADNEQATSVGQFQSADLGNYLKAIENISTTIGVITRTPKHYFYSTGADVSGEALLAMEAPLVKKVEQRQLVFEQTWQELGAFLYRLQFGGDLRPQDITVTWKPPASIQPLTQAQAVKTQVEAKIPLNTVLRRDGWSQGDMEQMEADRKEEEKRTTSTAKLLLDEMRAQDAQRNITPDGEDMDLQGAQNGSN